MAIEMFYGTVGALLAAEPDDVFDTIVDVEHLPEWNAAVRHVVEAPRGPLVEDSEWVVQARTLRFTRCRSRSRATAVDRGKRRFEYTSRHDDRPSSYVMWAWEVRADIRGSALTVVWAAAYPRSTWERTVLARARAWRLEADVRRSLTSLEMYLRT
jgi:hypothetical protein